MNRDFPWRATRDPYRIAVTELMLVRTRAEQVGRLWEAFFSRYPDLDTLAAAPDADVAQALAPLGLIWRARLVLRFARAAHSLPNWFLRIDELPGGGPYVASAAAIAVSGKGSLPVDVTIARVLARLHGIPEHRELRRARPVLCAAGTLGLITRRQFHAFLDLAALVCTPRSPRCESCPLAYSCHYALRRSEASQQSSST